MRQRTAVVIGGGVAGLATAAGLVRADWSVTVIDRGEPEPRLDTAFGLWSDAWAMLDRLGVLPGLAGRVTAIDTAELRAADGRLLARPRRPPAVGLVARTDLHDALVAVLPVGVLRRDDLDVGSGPLPTADLVVGADGVHSAVRARLAPVTARRLEVVCWRGTLPGPAPGVCETWGRGRMFGVTPGAPGRTNWFAAARTDRLPAPPSATTAHLRALFGDWHPGVTAVLDRLDAVAETGAPRIDRRDLLDLPRLPRWVGPGVALVGDAAHAMAPNLGRGAGEGLLDAAALVDALTEHPAVPRALQAYDRRRRRAADRVRWAARVLNRVSTAQRGVAVRDGVLATATRWTAGPTGLGPRRAADQAGR